MPLIKLILNLKKIYILLIKIFNNLNFFKNIISTERVNINNLNYIFFKYNQKSSF